MTFSTESLRRATAAVCAREGVDVGGLAPGELLELSGDVAQLRRDADVLIAELAAELRRRSETADPGYGLAGRHGYRSADELIARTTGGSVAEARRLIVAGGLLDGPGTTQETTTGDGPAEETCSSPMAGFRADLSDLVRDGTIGIEVAALVTETIARLPDTPRTVEVFSRVIAKVPGLPLHHVRKLIWRAQALADPAAWADREERQHESRTLTIRDDADGMVTLLARLTPLGAAPIRAVLDAGVRTAMQIRRDDPESDPRTAGQMRADILGDLCRHALDCTHATSGVKTTVVVRINLADLETGLGVGEVDGAPQPVSAAALRCAAADAEIIPAVLGGGSEILDWGRSRRMFTPAQRLALVERDGGCSWCSAPPSWCEAHHIRWWERDAGPTDLDNGILLCARCHHRLHRDAWEIRVHGREVEFIPPSSVDPTRQPIPGSRHRYDLAA